MKCFPQAHLWNALLEALMLVEEVHWMTIAPISFGLPIVVSTPEGRTHRQVPSFAGDGTIRSAFVHFSVLPGTSVSSFLSQQEET